MEKDRLTLCPGICAMASTEFCFEQKDCYTCPHGRKVFKKLSEIEYRERLFIPSTLCRGKKKGTDEYVVGQPVVPNGKFLQNKAYIAADIYCAHVCDDRSGELMLGGFIEVDPATLSFALYSDPKSGMAVFENDLLKFSHNDFLIVGVVRNGVYAQNGSGGEYPGVDVLGPYVEVIRILCQRASECADFCAEPSCTKWCFPEHLHTCNLLEVLKKEDVELTPATDPTAEIILQAIGGEKK